MARKEDYYAFKYYVIVEGNIITRIILNYNLYNFLPKCILMYIWYLEEEKIHFN